MREYAEVLTDEQRALIFERTREYFLKCYNADHEPPLRLPSFIVVEHPVGHDEWLARAETLGLEVNWNPTQRRGAGMHTDETLAAVVANLDGKASPQRKLIVTWKIPRPYLTERIEALPTPLHDALHYAFGRFSGSINDDLCGRGMEPAATYLNLDRKTLRTRAYTGMRAIDAYLYGERWGVPADDVLGSALPAAQPGRDWTCFPPTPRRLAGTV